METNFPNIHESESELARERVLADLRALAGDAEALLRATADDASEKAREARARLTAGLERARASYEDLQERGVASARAALKKADDTVRARPYEAIGVAFGLGVLLGVLLRRK